MIKLSFACFAAVLLCSCVLPQGAATPTKSSQSSVAFTVNGSPVTIEEIMKSPIVRPSIEQLLLLHGLKSMAAAQGIAIEESVVDQELAQIKSDALENGQSFERVLEDRGMIESDFRENLKINLYWEALLESRLDYTDEDLRVLWDATPARFNNPYAREHGLTDNERDALTFEDVYDDVFEAYKNDQFGFISQGLQQEIVDNTKLDLTCISDHTERRFFEDLIVNKRKTSYVEPTSSEEQTGSALSGAGQGESPVSSGEEAPNPCDDPSDSAGDDSENAELSNDPGEGH